MPQIGTLIDFEAGTFVRSSDVDQNFADIRNAFNNSAVLTDVVRTIVVAHTFNPPVPGPFAVLGTNAQNQLVIGLNAERLNGKPDTDFVLLADLPERVDDRVAALLKPGANITLTYDDALGTFTIAAAGGVMTDENVTVRVGGVSIGTRKINFLQGDGVGIAGVDDPANGEVDVTFRRRDRSARLYKTTPENISSATWTSLAFDAERWDDLGHDNAVNNNRLPTPIVGRWMVLGQVHFSGSGVGVRGGRIMRNGGVVNQDPYSGFYPGSASGNVVPVLGLVDAAAVTDYVELQGYQDTGGLLAVAVTNTVFQAFFLGGA